MPVMRIKGGVVVQVYRDVDTLAQARKKYSGLKGLGAGALKVGGHPPGTRFVGQTAHPPPPSPPPEESSSTLAIRAIAQAVGPGVTATIDAILGPPPGQ